MTDAHDERGRWLPGNPGGPGRPPRAIETDYLRTLADRLTPDRWAAIVERAVTDAEAGDAKAREWLARYALGPAPLTLVGLAVRELAGASTADEVAAANALADTAGSFGRLLRDNLGYQTPAEGALVIAHEREAATKRESEIAAEREARERRRQARAAKAGPGGGDVAKHE